MDQWYFERDGSPAGPVAFDELQRLARTGVVGRDSRVWSEGMSDWVAAGTVERLWASEPRPFEAAVVPASAAPAYHPAAPLAAEVGMRTPSHGASLASAVDVEKMVGNMRFVGLFTIIWGALSCLGIITAVIGIPMVIAGIRLREAADRFEQYARAGDDGALAAALERQGSYFFIQKVFILIALAFMVLYFVAIFFFLGSMGMAGLAGQ
jgi:hypothetical protein